MSSDEQLTKAHERKILKGRGQWMTAAGMSDSFSRAPLLENGLLRTVIKVNEKKILTEEH